MQNMKSCFIAASAIGIAATAFATVSTTLTSDTYIVMEGSGAGAKFYSVLDVYIKGSSDGDTFAGVTGLNNASDATKAHPVIFATSRATGTGLVRDASGKITAGSVTSDAFVQSDNSSWLPNNASGNARDSFLAFGFRKQNSSITNRFGTVKDQTPNFTVSSAFSSAGTANSNYILNSGDVAWYSALGASPYLSGGVAVTSENPFARLSLYNSSWAASYPTLDRTGGVLTSKGQMQSGRATAAGADVFTGVAGTSLDYCAMIGRFAIDVSSDASATSMQVQFNIVGKNGTSAEVGTTFTGAITSTYKVSQFFSFAVPAPGACALLSVAGLLGRRRKA